MRKNHHINVRPAVEAYPWIAEDHANGIQQLPPYDKGLFTRKFLLFCFILVSLLSVAILSIGIYAQIVGFDCKKKLLLTDDNTGYDPTLLWCNFFISSDDKNRALTIALTVMVALSTECLGYIHSITLRWALAAEGRLEFNSNMRLFSAAHKSLGNNIIANTFFAAFLALSYAGASCSLVASRGSWLSNDWDLQTLLWYRYGYISTDFSLGLTMFAVGIIGLGAGLLGLCVVTGIGWWSEERRQTIKSWNAHPLNTALACLHHKLLFRRRGRATMNSAERSLPDKPARRLEGRQPSALETIPTLNRIFLFAMGMLAVDWILACASLFYILIARWSWQSTMGLAWYFFPEFVLPERAVSAGLLSINLTPYELPDSFLLLWPLLWAFLWQLISALGFHLIELVVNLRRDEAYWRKASSDLSEDRDKGARFNQNCVTAAFVNKGSMVLLCLKPTGQWLLGLGAYTTLGATVGLNPLPLFALSVPLALVAIATRLTVGHRPKGPQPTAYGHLQTIVDLVDDWGAGSEGSLWWGDKGAIIMHNDEGREFHRRRVGTYGNLDDYDDIDMDAKYSAF